MKVSIRRFKGLGTQGPQEEALANLHLICFYPKPRIQYVDIFVRVKQKADQKHSTTRQKYALTPHLSFADERVGAEDGCATS